jgi:hypothetical protein
VNPIEPQGFFDRIKADLDHLARTVEADAQSLAGQLRGIDRVLVPRPDNPGHGSHHTGNPDSPDDPEPAPRRPGGPRRLDPEEARRLYEQGWTNAQIAERFGVTPLRVSIVLREMGVRRPPHRPTRPPVDIPPAPRRPGGARRLDPDEALRLYQQGWTNAQIAERFGVTPLRVSIVLRSRGVRRPRGARPAIAVSRDEVLRLHNQGLPPADIAPMVGG